VPSATEICARPLFSANIERERQQPAAFNKMRSLGKEISHFSWVCFRFRSGLSLSFIPLSVFFFYVSRFGLQLENSPWKRPSFSAASNLFRESCQPQGHLILNVTLTLGSWDTVLFTNVKHAAWRIVLWEFSQLGERFFLFSHFTAAVMGNGTDLCLLFCNYSWTLKYTCHLSVLFGMEYITRENASRNIFSGRGRWNFKF
jgi:hypothetical protein